MRFGMLASTVKQFILFIISAIVFQGSAKAEDTRPTVFITELVQDLGAISEIRDRAADDIQRDQYNPNLVTDDCIRNSTSLILERRSQIERLQQMKFAEPFSFLVPGIASLWKESLALDERTVAVCKTILKGPEAIQSVAGEMPEISAKLDYLDKAFFEVMPAAILTLVSQTPDSQGHMSFLVISKAEKNGLIREIELTFGDKLKATNPKYLIASIVMLRRFLDDGHKTTD